MRLAVFQDWGILGVAVARRLHERGGERVRVFGSTSVPPWERDAGLADAVIAGDPHDPAWLDALLAFAPDVLVVATFSWRLPTEALAAARLDAVNLHPGPLPSLRGPAPEFWAIRRGLPHTALTLHRLVERFDAGPVLARRQVPLRPRDDRATLARRLAPVAGALLDRYLARLARDGPAVGVAQDPALAAWAPAIRPEHLHLRWAEGHAAADALVRAARPDHEAVTSWRGRPLAIRRARPLAGPLPAGILATGPLRVGTGDGALALGEVRVGDEGPIAGAAFARRVAEGERLGEG